jgi:hypothetical protein
MFPPFRIFTPLESLAACSVSTLLLEGHWSSNGVYPFIEQELCQQITEKKACFLQLNLLKNSKVLKFIQRFLWN